MRSNLDISNEEWQEIGLKFIDSDTITIEELAIAHDLPTSAVKNVSEKRNWKVSRAARQMLANQIRELSELRAEVESQSPQVALEKALDKFEVAIAEYAVTRRKLIDTVDALRALSASVDMLRLQAQGRAIGEYFSVGIDMMKMPLISGSREGGYRLG